MTSTQPSPKRPQLPPAFPIYWRDNIAYERARVGRVFNYRRPDRYPVAVVEPINDDHVVQAVKLAKDLNCRVSIRSGGHSWASWSVRDDAVLIDFGRFHFLSLNKKNNVLTVSPNMTGRLISQLLQPHGRWFPGGHCPDVAVGGFLLQGGMGWNCFPAIVTRFHLQTLPAPGFVGDSMYLYPTEHTRAALDWIIKLSPGYDADTEIVAIGNYIPGLEGPHTAVRLVTFKNTEAEARAALKLADETAPPGAVMRWCCETSSILHQYDIQHAANPEGHRYHVDNCYIDNDADVVSLIEKSFTEIPTAKSFSLWYSMAPGSRRNQKAGEMKEMALSMQTDHYYALYAVCETPAQDKECIKWLNDNMNIVKYHSPGAYLGDSDFQRRQTKYWTDENAAKLMYLRQKFDPAGRIAGYLNAGDTSGADGLANQHDWVSTMNLP
ncbi:hypothetical protein SEUCBS140593_002294 [Sporothrix eucalyptigena]|uniref:FAD-binding PCMH-type domain-containing protein n=1 Tax=Sporothrix eucalyptigena TaxID=1812306 RepID=A0ABP0B626_9PEZI